MIEILMTIKDRQDYLNKQIEYLNPYLTDEIQLTIYDDGSITPLIASQSSNRIRLIRGEENVGLIEARNILLRNALPDSRYVLFLDDDIFIYNFKKFIDVSLEHLTNDSSLLAVSCPYINLPTYKYEHISTFRKLYDTDKTDSSYVVYFFGGTSLFDRFKLVDIGGFEGKYKIYLEEEDLALRAFCKSLFFKVIYNKDFIAIHDQAPGKDFYERSVFLLSNRFLFHYKFIKSSFIRGVLNLFYLFVYLLKKRDLSLLHKSLERYQILKPDFQRLDCKSIQLYHFLKKRFF